ncbi:MAG: hypothetical protein WBC44_11675 [Planctomycetaceae bacterium]
MIPPDDVPPLDPPREVATGPVVAAPGQLRRLAQRLEFDRAVFYALAARVWQMLAGPITVLLIATHFDAETQGYYYAFGSLLAVQAMFELNLGVVLLNAAGHEWPLLRLDSRGRVTGDAGAVDRLAGLDRFGSRWYGVAALLCLFAIGAVGHRMFRELPTSGQAAWAVTVTTASAMLVLMPRMAILQGCHQMVAVNRNIAMQAVCGTLAVWSCVLAGMGLWAVAASWSTKLMLDFWLVFGRYSTFFRSLPRKSAPRIPWKTTIWPLQWRLALQAIAASAATSSFVLALFHLGSKDAAGRMGMTLSVLNMLLWGGLAWVQTRIPVLAGYSRQNDRVGYDRLFRKITIATVAAVLFGAVAFWGVVIAMRLLELTIADRFIGTTAFALLAAAIVMQHLLNCLTIYSRTRLREPFVVPNVVLNLAIAAGSWLIAPFAGELGVAVIYAVLAIGVGLPVWLVVWRRDRQTWSHAAVESGMESRFRET